MNEWEAWSNDRQATCPGLLHSGMGVSGTNNLRVARQKSFHWATAPWNASTVCAASSSNLPTIILKHDINYITSIDIQQTRYRPAVEASTANVASLLASAFSSPAPRDLTLDASESCHGWGAANDFVVVDLVTVSTTTCDCSWPTPDRPEPSHNDNL